MAEGAEGAEVYGWLKARLDALEGRVGTVANTQADNVKLREHLEARIDALRERLDDRLSALEKLLTERSVRDQLAISKAESAVNQRLESMNEFRSQLNSQAALFVTEDKLRVMVDGISVRIEAMQRVIWLATGAVAGLSLLLTVVSFLLNYSGK